MSSAHKHRLAAITRRSASFLLLLSLSVSTSVVSAAKATPSRFAGTWCGPLFADAWPPLSLVYQLRIADNGRISGGFDGFWQVSYSGRVIGNGVMELVIDVVSRGGFDIPNINKIRRSRFYVKALVARDNNGSLVGIAAIDGVEPTPFVWSPCP